MTQTFEPMLAAKPKPIKGDPSFDKAFKAFLDKVRYPILCSPKFDGIRMAIQGGLTKTRSLKEVPNTFVRKTFEDLRLEGFDGELIVGKPNANDVYNRTNSVVMSHGKPIDELFYYVFDVWTNYKKSFVNRLGDVDQYIERLKSDRRTCDGCEVRTIFVPHKLISSPEELLAYELEQVEQGYEGIMGRNPNGIYKFGRSTITDQCLMAFKRRVDTEWEIVGFLPLYKNTNEATVNELGRTTRSSAQAGKVAQEKLGAYICKTKDGLTFEVGSGSLFTDANRVKLWQERESSVGMFLKGSSLEIGVKDRPRQPTATGLRDPRDMS